MKSCPACSSTLIDHDSNTGCSVCTRCGVVIEENSIVSEVTFTETASGASVLQGQFIPDGSLNMSTLGGGGGGAGGGHGGMMMMMMMMGGGQGGGGGGHGGGGQGGQGGAGGGHHGHGGHFNSSLFAKESRELTIQNGRRLIQHTASALRLTPYHVDAAHRLFLLAMHHNFIQGRRTQNVVAACLYIVCRREKTPRMSNTYFFFFILFIHLHHHPP